MDIHSITIDEILTWNPCWPGRDWLCENEAKSLEELWATCKDGLWMFWFICALEKRGTDLHLVDVKVRKHIHKLLVEDTQLCDGTKLSDFLSPEIWKAVAEYEAARIWSLDVRDLQVIRQIEHQKARNVIGQSLNYYGRVCGVEQLRFYTHEGTGNIAPTCNQESISRSADIVRAVLPTLDSIAQWFI